MADFTLYLGNKAYSSWSLRAWLAMARVGVPFDEVVLPFDGPTGAPSPLLRQTSPSAKVPLLKHRDLLVWDSLAIGEYLAELFPDAGLWPADPRARATARAVAAEMHSGFAALRGQMPMNVRREPFVLSAGGDVAADVARVVALWDECRRSYGASGPFLFGRYSLADMMFAPVAFRFRTYGVALPAEARDYVETVLALPDVQSWVAAARQEPWVIAKYERVGEVGARG